MELIQGRTLLDRWTDFTNVNVSSRRNHLSEIMKTLRRLEQGASVQYIGTPETKM